MAVAVSQAMDPAAAAVLLRGLAVAPRDRLIAALPPEAALRIRDSLHYPAGSAGALLDPSAFTTLPEATAGEALAQLRLVPGRLRAYVFVVARDGRLVGVADLSTLMAAPVDRPVASVARPDPARLSAAATHAEILAHPSWSDLRVLPVVDHQRRFLGVIRFRTLRELAGVRGARADTTAVGLGVELGELCCGFVVSVLDELAHVDSTNAETAKPGA